MWRVRFFKTELAGGLDSRLSWVASSSCEVAEQSVCIFLSCSTLASMTLQILACLVCVQLLATRKLRATCEIQSRVPVSLHNLEHFFTLSHTLSLHDSHLNIGLLIAKIRVNLAWNKANKMVDKIQPYTCSKFTSLRSQSTTTNPTSIRLWSNVATRSSLHWRCSRSMDGGFIQNSGHPNHQLPWQFQSKVSLLEQNEIWPRGKIDHSAGKRVARYMM